MTFHCGCIYLHDDDDVDDDDGRGDDHSGNIDLGDAAACLPR